MSESKPVSRTEATKPKATAHLNAGEKEALDLSSEVEHSHAAQREKLTEDAEDAAQKKPEKSQ